VNVDQAKKDRLDREAVIASLHDALKKGDKSLVGNKGYRKYLRAGGKQFTVDEEKLEDTFRRWYPNFRPNAATPVEAVSAA